MTIASVLHVWFCRCLRVLLVAALLVFLAMCYALWGDMGTLARVIASILTTLAGGVVIGLAALIGGVCRRGGRLVNLRRRILVWAIAVFTLLALSIIIPSFGGTFYTHKTPDSGGHHWDWD